MNKIEKIVLCLITCIVMVTTVNTKSTFSGWNRLPDGTGENFNANTDKYSGITTEEIVTLYANWQPPTTLPDFE